MRIALIVAIFAGIEIASPQDAFAGNRGGAQMLSKGGNASIAADKKRMNLVRGACRSDIVAHCRQFMGKPPKVWACLGNSPVSGPCRSAIDNAR
jgi:hypothetical protein